MANTLSTFESAMERLRQIVEQMESDKLPLEEMLERYEEGTRLVQFCSEKLSAAEKRIEIIARNASGKPRIADFENSAASEAAPIPEVPETKPAKQAKPAAKPPPDRGDVSLF